MKKITLLLTFLALIGCSNNEKVLKEEAKTRQSTETSAMNADTSNLPELTKDGLTVHYSKGYKDKAELQMERLLAMRNFYNDKMNLKIETTVNILDREDKDEIVGPEIPYGMPFVVDATSEIFLPATEEGVIVDATLKYKDNLPKESLELFKKADYTPEEGIKKYPDLIGIHEVGHTVVFEVFHDRTGKYPVWFHELMATYASYSFMSEKYPDLANLWMANSYIRYLDGSKPQYTTFNEFALYAPEHMTSANYDWYQKQINFIAKDLYDEMGLEFFNIAKNKLTKDQYTSEEMLEELQTLSPAFKKWVKALDDKTESFNTI